jgi:hypothetical protein
MKKNEAADIKKDGTENFKMCYVEYCLLWQTYEETHKNKYYKIYSLLLPALMAAISPI